MKYDKAGISQVALLVYIDHKYISEDGPSGIPKCIKQCTADELSGAKPFISRNIPDPQTVSIEEIDSTKSKRAHKPTGLEDEYILNDKYKLVLIRDVFHFIHLIKQESGEFVIKCYGELFPTYSCEILRTFIGARGYITATPKMK